MARLRHLILAAFVLALGWPIGPVAAPARVFRDCAGCPRMVVVPAMPRPFAIGRFEITRAEFAAFSKTTGRPDPAGCYRDTRGDGTWRLDPAASWRRPGFAQSDRHPVVCVSWADARAYVRWLNSRVPGGGYRLPTEAEWEHAARAGAKTAYPWGDAAGTGHANHGRPLCCGGEASGRDRWLHTAPVGSFPANAFGLSDMSGNVWEWLEDCHEAPACDRRTVRGGSWSDPPAELRVSVRHGFPPDASRGDSGGFRVARTLP